MREFIKIAASVFAATMGDVWRFATYGGMLVFFLVYFGLVQGLTFVGFMAALGLAALAALLANAIGAILIAFFLSRMAKALVAKVKAVLA